MNCRVCLCSKPRKNLTEINLSKNGEQQSYQDVMLFCLGIKIDNNSNMSTKLCVKCYRKIIEFYYFKTLAIINNAHLLSLESSASKNEVFLTDVNIKKEKVSEDGDCGDQEEPMIQIKEDDLNYEPDFMIEIKDEYKQEDQSDDECLSVIKTMKYQSAEETKENVSSSEPVKKKRGRPKKSKTQKEETKSKICDECGKEVKNLTAHLSKHLPAELRKQVKCELCDKVFSSVNLKRKHVKRKHLAVKKQCHLCDKSVANLKQHILTIHNTDSLPFQCVPCGRRFISQTRLDSHLTVHTKDRPFECEMCGGKFRLKISLVMHKRQVHDKEKSHLCQFCSKSFFKKHHLHVHLRSHTKEKPYPCPECGKHFQSSTTLKNHRLIHSKEKNFNCTMCEMSFSTGNYLRAHIISHRKEKRYPCQYCDVKFHRSDHRKRHEYTAHLRHAVGNT